MPEYINKIRTASGDLPINYEALANLPTISNPNLLINSDFRKPINQRSQTTYKSDTNNFTRVFTIDRWNMQNGCKCVVNSGSITLSGDSAANGVGIFCQVLEILPKDNYTVQVKVKSISGGAEVAITDSTSKTVFNGALHAGLNTFTITNTDVFFVSINLASNAVVELEWIKLEAGTTATTFSPRPVAEELMLCKRYFDIMGGTRAIGVEQDTSANTLTYIIPRTGTMARIPTISVGGTAITNSTEGICVRTIGCLLLTGFTFTYSVRNCELLIVAKSQSALTNQCYETQVYINDAFKIYLDAEIY